MNDIIERLRSTLSNEPSDDALWDRVIEERHDAALEIERLRRHVDALQEKVVAESCACGYDSPDAVCLAHSPQLSAALADVERLTRDRRERIATAAMQGMLACVENGIAPESWADFIPQRAVIYADALIAKLDKEAKP